MVDWVLSLAQRQITTLPPAAEGHAPVPQTKGGFGSADNIVMVLTASTTDHGAGALPPLRGFAEVMLRSRRQRAACFDFSENAAAQDNLDEGGLVARLQPGGWIGFARIRQQDVGQVKLSAWPQGGAPLTVSIFAGDVELAKKIVPASPAASGRPQELVFPMPPANADAAPQQMRAKFDGPAGSVLDVMWVEFKRP
jgi:hypothetical protein